MTSCAANRSVSEQVASLLPTWRAVGNQYALSDSVLGWTFNFLIVVSNVSTSMAFIDFSLSSVPANVLGNGNVACSSQRMWEADNPDSTTVVLEFPDYTEEAAAECGCEPSEPCSECPGCMYLKTAQGETQVRVEEVTYDPTTDSIDTTMSLVLGGYGLPMGPFTLERTNPGGLTFAELFSDAFEAAGGDSAAVYASESSAEWFIAQGEAKCVATCVGYATDASAPCPAGLVCRPAAATQPATGVGTAEEQAALVVEALLHGGTHADCVGRAPTAPPLPPATPLWLAALPEAAGYDTSDRDCLRADGSVATSAVSRSFRSTPLAALPDDWHDEFAFGGAAATGAHACTGDRLVVFAPYKRPHIAVFDAGSGNLTYHDVSATLTTWFKFGAAATAPDGRVVFAPYNANGIGVFDATSGGMAYHSIEQWVDASLDFKYTGAARAPDGLVVLAPGSADGVIMFDPERDHVSYHDVSAVVSPSFVKFIGATLAPNGLVVFAPYMVGSVGLWNASSATLALVDIDDSCGGRRLVLSPRFEGAATAGNGLVVFAPSDAHCVGLFDAASRTFRAFDISATVNVSAKFSGAATTSSGLVVFAPFEAGGVGVFDAEGGGAFWFHDLSATSWASGASTQQLFRGVAVASDGLVVFAPYQSDAVMWSDDFHAAPPFAGTWEEAAALCAAHPDRCIGLHASQLGDDNATRAWRAAQCPDSASAASAGVAVRACSRLTEGGDGRGCVRLIKDAPSPPLPSLPPPSLPPLPPPHTPPSPTAPPLAPPPSPSPPPSRPPPSCPPSTPPAAPLALGDSLSIAGTASIASLAAGGASLVLLLLGCGALAWRRRATALALRVELSRQVELSREQQLELARQAELSREQKEALERQLGNALSAPLHGSRIDMSQLQLGAVLGEGAFGRVRRGVYQQTPCAVKQLKRNRLTEEALAAFKREVEMQLDLRHPNIIQLIGWCWNLDEGLARTTGQTEAMGVACIKGVGMVLELGGNGTLGKLLADPLSELDWGHERLSIGLGVARAMAYLHSVHIIHRDLKPENVLLGDAMVAKVADFGVSREGTVDLTMTAVGTPLFASPEVLTHSRYDETVDVWSFGCVLTCLHHWRPTPYPGEPTDSLVSRIVAGEVRPSEALPDGAPFKTLVQRCNKFDAEERPSFLALCEELELRGQIHMPPLERLLVRAHTSSPRVLCRHAAEDESSCASQVALASLISV